MQIVIDIPQEIYDAIYEDYYGAIVMDKAYITDRIRKGVPLPEHHGRLIDLDRLISENLFGGYVEMCEEELNKVPVVLEGDKE